MKLTPLDIRQQQFGTKLRGYNTEEVDAFLEAIAQDLESLLKEHREDREHLTVLSAELESARSEEHEIKKTLLAVYQVREDLVSQATKEAQLTLKEARLRADDIIRQARERREQVINQIADLEEKHRLFLLRVQSLLETHLKLLEDPAHEALQNDLAAAMSADDGDARADAQAANHTLPVSENGLDDGTIEYELEDANDEQAR